MSEEIEEVAEVEGVGDVEEVYDEDILEEHQNDLMELFEEQSFFEKWRRVGVGLKMPKESGMHKWARLQMLRLLSPLAAVVVPVILLGLITVFSKFDNSIDRKVTVQVVDPEKMDKLDDVPEPEPEDIEPPDPVEIDVSTPNVDLPPSKVAAPPKDTTVQQATVDSVAIVKSPVMMRGIYGSRSPGSRGAALSKYGGGSGTEGAVLRALRYLKMQQRPDGAWGRNPVAMTSLVVLAYLAHGDTPGSPEFGETVKKGIEFLVAHQDAKGDFNPHDGHNYTLPIATYAVAESYAVTKIPKLKTATIRSIKRLIKGQSPDGGYSYNLSGDPKQSDSSYMGWCVQALKSAKMAGLMDEIPGLHKCMDNCIKGFQKLYYERDGYGMFGYRKSNHSFGGLTGVGALCLQFLGGANTRECRSALRTLNTWHFDWKKPKAYGHSFLYYNYYITQARFQEGGASWKSWNAEFAPQLIQHQKIIQKNDSGYVDPTGQKRAIGSWKSPTDEHDGGEAIMHTILCTLMLEVYYRYLPTFLVVPENNKADEAIGDDDDLGLDFGYVEPARHKEAEDFTEAVATL